MLLHNAQFPGECAEKRDLLETDSSAAAITAEDPLKEAGQEAGLLIRFDSDSLLILVLRRR